MGAGALGAKKESVSLTSDPDVRAALELAIEHFKPQEQNPTYDQRFDIPLWDLAFFIYHGERPTGITDKRWDPFIAAGFSYLRENGKKS